MKHLSSITVFLSSSSRSLFRRTPPSPFFFNPEHETTTLVGISHFSTSSSPDSYHSHSRRNSEDVRNVRVSVWWDFENCQVPCNVNVYKVTHFITSAVRSVGIKGPIQITAFGDVVQLSRSNQEALSSTGINLTHIPNGSSLSFFVIC
ncbi:putative NYN domain, limkain-b1-type, meiosis regulator and mRNA stability factor 1 [Helianthus annuus]|nr:putative NYN domain, limkain-b1-type, meiosis regulator and mRNA stability factor 1 [Helianthus annuus]KAJ0696869.1 putative NYN domain, limkain-b1-type, meiosis regulator and mRNA stability factor 1 [Helianthus annuus]KAJ0700309.1 putative NYN domain, limkain-b1-type, meiosis regulator and mRNA stability factor 1 [Helianthus annuus]